jgi:hypothetical protein
MGVGAPEKKRGRLEVNYGATRMTEQDQLELLKTVTHTFVDVEGRVFSQCCRSDSIDLLVQEIRLLVENMLQRSPNMVELSFVFDYSPTKPSEVKNILRSEKRSVEPIDEKFVALLDPKNVVDASATGWKEFTTSMRRALLANESDYLTRCMYTPYLRRCIRRMWAEQVFDRIKNKWPETLRVNVVNVEQEDGSYSHYTNGAAMKNICTNSAGEAELEIISRIGTCSSDDVVRIISEDSDVLAALPMAMQRLGPTAPRVILDFGNSTKVFDATKLYSGIVQTGINRQIKHIEIAHAVEYAMGGTDFVKGIPGFADARVYAFMNAIGYHLVHRAFWTTVVDGKIALNVSLEKMRFIVHLAMAGDDTKNQPKTDRQRRFVALKNKEKIDLPPIDDMAMETCDRTPQAGIVVPPENICAVYAHQVAWQVLYWFYRHRDTTPNEFEVREGLPLWGWTRDESGAARIANKVYCGSLK